MKIGENSLNNLHPRGKEKQKKQNKFNINNPIYRSIGSNKLYKHPDEYIEVYDIKKFEWYSTPKNQGRTPPILVGKPKNFVKIIVKINIKFLPDMVFNYFSNTFCVVCKILLSSKFTSNTLCLLNIQIIFTNCLRVLYPLTNDFKVVKM